MDNIVWWSAALSMLGGLVLSATCTGLIRKRALKGGFVDQPGGHKRHLRPVALGGGIAITLALTLPVLLFFFMVLLFLKPEAPPDWLPAAAAQHLPGLWHKAPAALGLVAGAWLLHALGIIDDRKQLGAWSKLAVQLGVGAYVAIFLKIRIMTIWGPALSITATIFWVVLITNAFNFLDNMDGLCAGVAAITAVIFAFSAILMDQIFVPTLACLVAGVMLGFLCYNYPPANIFMGDAGSLVIGYFMSVLTILTTYWDPALQGTRIGLLVPVMVLAVPLYDTTSVVLIRLRQGISPFRGDQRHFSHRLIQRGMSPKLAVHTIYLATAATGLSAAVLPRVSLPLGILLLLQSALVVLLIALLEQARNNGQA